MVRLVAGNPGTDELLVGFVEEGADNRPFELGPGQERHFVLSLNAQNANRERYRFPVRIHSDAGYADEAEVQVAVRLPVVNLAWEELGPAETGLGTRLRLTNNGDSLTDLTIQPDSRDISISPSVDHGLFPAGRSLEITAYPRLYDGFRSVTETITATAVNQSSSHEVTLTVPDGESVYMIMLSPEAGAEQVDPDDADLLMARAMSAAHLNPSYIRPSDWTGATDTTGDGRANRWVFVDELERILWVGEDTVGDGEVDYVSADVGFDGQFDYAAIFGDEGWQRTSILDVWIETGFTHPRNRASYDPYDVDIVLNGVVVGELRDTIPEGNHRFRVPPTALSFNEAGVPEGNTLEVRSRRMGRGSYGMTSDFQVKTRLTSMPIWTVAPSREEAVQAVRETEGLMLNEPDYSVASDELVLTLPEEVAAGAVATLTVPVRNFGVAPGGVVGVALSQSAPRGAEVEIQRRYLAEVPVNGVAMARFEWSLAAGHQRYKVTVDPDEETDDTHRGNNEAYIWVEVPGDDSPPTVQILSPAAGDTLTDPVVTIRARAQDDIRVARVEARVDDGLWAPLAWDEDDDYSATALLQPGARVVTVRATDAAGNVAQATANVTVQAPAPDIQILTPEANASTDLRHAEVSVRCGEDVAMLAVRVNEGPWQALRVDDGSATGTVALTFGENVLEVKAVSARGVERVEAVTVTCTTQRTEEEAEAEAERPPVAPVDPDEPPPADTVDVEGFGPREINEDDSRVLPPAPDRPRTPPGAPPAPDVPEEEPVEVEEPELPEISEEIHRELDALENGEADEVVTDEVEEYDGGPTDPAELDEEQMPLDDLLPILNEMLMDFFRNLVDQHDVDALLDTDDVVEDELPPGVVLPPHGLSGPPPPGRSVGVQHTQRTNHCTNRPNIRMPFRMPEWLLALDLPEPGTDEYEAMVSELLARLWAQGIDVEVFEDFHQMLRRRAGRLESPEELPGFWQSVAPYFFGPEPQDPDELRQWREAMTRGVDAFWLRLLASGDPDLIHQGLRARAEAFGKYDEGLQLGAQAVMEEVQRHQNNAETVMSMIPYVGTAMDVLMLARGESLAGEQLTAGRVAMMGGFRALTWGGPKFAGWIHRKAMGTQSGRMFFQAVSEMGGNLGAGGIRNMARVLGRSEDEVRTFFSWAGDHMTRQRSMRGGVDWLLGRKAQTASRNFVPFRAGQSAIYRQRIERRHAENLLDRMASTTDRREFRRLTVQLQGNKTAQAVINTPRYAELARRADRTRSAMGRLADRHTTRAIRNLPPERSGLQRVVQSNPGVNPDDVVVRARTITGGRTGFGRDRDVWYEFVDARTGRRLGDVHHDVSGRIYNDNIQRITGRSARDLDHAVTSAWHPDAYATGVADRAAHERAAGAIVDGCSAGRLRRARDVADTARYKPNEWFSEARTATNPVTRNQNLREGMRQATKEYQRHVEPYVWARPRGPAAMPPRLRHGLDIFQQVQDGILDDSMTVEQGLQALDAIGATPETIVEDLAQYINFINVWGLD